MKKQIAEHLLRLAPFVGRNSRQSGRNIFAIGTYRIVGAIVSLLGGSLESRIMSFVIPDNSTDELRVTQTLQELESALSLKGMPLRIRKKSLSRSEAMKAEDVRPLLPEGADRMTFYELFVATHYFWEASLAIENVLKDIQEREVVG